MQDATCIVCGGAFQRRPRGERQNRYCGDECYRKAAALRRGGGRGLVPCGICGAPCRRYGKTACCSDACRRERERRRSAARYAANPGGSYRAHAHLWRVQNARRKDRIAALTIPGLMNETKIAARIAYWGSMCWVCGSTGAERDHVKPLGAGGAHLPANIRPICGTCNRRKKDAWPIDTRRRAPRRSTSLP